MRLGPYPADRPDRLTPSPRLAYSWGASEAWSERFLNPSKVLTGFYTREFCRDGEPLILSNILPLTGPYGEQIFADLSKAERIIDVMQTVVLREARRIAVFTASRHEDQTRLEPDAIAVMRLLAPHIKRAVMISDLLDLGRIEAGTLAATLDSFTPGVVMVGERSRILHANDAARRMLAARTPITAVSGCLKACNPEADRQLAEAIALARTDEAKIVGSGIGVPLRDASPSIAHVLPLARGACRGRLVPEAVAALFITQAERFAPGDAEAFGKCFGLTSAEAKLLTCLTSGDALGDAANKLGIGRETARTHLAHVFAKTGVGRQSDLLALVSRLVPPVSKADRPGRH